LRIRQKSVIKILKLIRFLQKKLP